ncbi:MAG: TrbC/VirB2 family protein [Deltaproteobacteria bacterium]|nr:TrbC/VirB2 family protein [Deltaproteobacteria bacterium]
MNGSNTLADHALPPEPFETATEDFKAAIWKETKTKIILRRESRGAALRARLRRLLRMVSGPVLLALVQLAVPSLALAGRLSGTLSQTNTELREFIQGDIATMVMLLGFCAAGWTLVTRREGFGWACTVFVVGVVLKNLTWLLDTASDLSSTLR